MSSGPDGVRSLNLRMHQPEKDIPFGRGNGGAVIVNRPAVIAPSGGAERAVGLERKSNGSQGPGNRNLIAGAGDAQERRTRGLHGDQAPKAAGQGIVSARHGRPGVVLPDRAGDRIQPVGARAAAARDFKPRDGILLRHPNRRHEKTRQ